MPRFKVSIAGRHLHQPRHEFTQHRDLPFNNAPLFHHRFSASTTRTHLLRLRVTGDPRYVSCAIF
jgi:hypothetical protein